MVRFVFLLTCLFILDPSSSFGQIFYEDFSTCSNSGVTTSGTDNISGVPWSTTCPSSVAGTDYFQCSGGQLEARDTNGEAAFITGVIDVSSCVGSELSFTLSESGDMEDCSDCGGTGTNCVDYVYAEYNLDGAGWTGFFTGTTCGLTLPSGKELVQIGNMGGSTTWTSSCIDYGEELEIRIFVSCWAGSEYWHIDNVTVSCNDCILPIELVNFHVTGAENKAHLSWSTMSEHSNDRFEIERSFEGKNFKKVGEVNGAGNSSVLLNYSYTDRYSTLEPTVYYRLKQVDENGDFKYSDIKSIRQTTFNVSHFNDKLHLVATNTDYQNLTYRIYSITGQLLSSGKFSNAIELPWQKRGMIIIEIPELGKRQKVLCVSSY